MLKLNSRDLNIIFSSDWHINHANYCDSTSRWENKDKCRRFSGIEEMNHTILESFYLLPKDTYLFLLGDTLFGQSKDYYTLFDNIDSDNIYHIYGNHDNKNIFEQNIHPKIKFYGDILIVSIDGQQIILTHRPLLSWEDMNRIWCLHGHTHGELEYPKNFQDRLHYGYSPKIMDVGIDNYYKLHKQYKYFTWNEIKETFK